MPCPQRKGRCCAGICVPWERLSPFPRAGARAGSAAPCAAAPPQTGLACLPLPPARGIPGAGWERNPAHCWSGEGEEAHSSTTLWAGLLPACSLTHWATRFSSLCWPKGIFFSLVLEPVGCDTANQAWEAYASHLLSPTALCVPAMPGRYVLHSLEILAIYHKDNNPCKTPVIWCSKHLV